MQHSLLTQARSWFPQIASWREQPSPRQFATAPDDVRERDSCDSGSPRIGVRSSEYSFAQPNPPNYLQPRITGGKVISLSFDTVAVTFAGPAARVHDTICS